MKSSLKTSKQIINSLRIELETLRQTLERQGRESGRIEGENKKLIIELQKKETELSDLESRFRNFDLSVEKLQKDLDVRKKKISNLTNKLTLSSREIEKLKSELTSARKTLAEQPQRRGAEGGGTKKKEETELTAEQRARLKRHSKYQVFLIKSFATKIETSNKLVDALKKEGFRVSQIQYLSGLDKAIKRNPALAELRFFERENRPQGGKSATGRSHFHPLLDIPPPGNHLWG